MLCFTPSETLRFFSLTETSQVKCSDLVAAQDNPAKLQSRGCARPELVGEQKSFSSAERGVSVLKSMDIRGIWGCIRENRVHGGVGEKR